MRHTKKNRAIDEWLAAVGRVVLGLTIIIGAGAAVANAAANPPVVTGLTPTRDATPIWSWTSGGGGNGTFRYKLDAFLSTGGATETRLKRFSPLEPLAEGKHTLYVQEQDETGKWSASGNKAIVVDLTPPGAPIIKGVSPTADSTPTLTWASSGGGNGQYRYKLDNANLVLDATATAVAKYTPVSPLTEGQHVLFVQERDAAGNWSLPGKKAFAVDLTPPNAPVVKGVSPTTDSTPTWTWTSGRGGNNTYRYKLDNHNLAAGATITTLTEFTPENGMAMGKHTLYVQERDAAGNWSTKGTKVITVKPVFEGVIVFLRDSQLFRLKNDLSGIEVIASGIVGGKFALSATGNIVAFKKSGTIWLINPDGTGATDTGVIGNIVSLSADGSILYYSVDGTVWSMHAAGDQQTNLGLVAARNWAPDLSKYVVVSYGSHPPQDYNDDSIWVTEHQADGAFLRDFQAGWSMGDWALLAYNGTKVWIRTAENDGYTVGDIGSYSPDGTAKVLVTNDVLKVISNIDGTELFAYNLLSSANAIAWGGQAWHNVWYKDSDGDGYSNGTTKVQATKPAGFFPANQLSLTTGDCNDANATIHAGATDIPGNGIDEDCSGEDSLPPFSSQDLAGKWCVHVASGSFQAEFDVNGKLISGFGSFSMDSKGKIGAGRQYRLYNIPRFELYSGELSNQKVNMSGMYDYYFESTYMNTFDWSADKGECGGCPSCSP